MTVQDREKWIQEFVRDRGHFIGFLRVLCRDAEQAEDLFQELSVKVIESIGNFDPSLDFGAWVRGIARNLYRKSLRNQSRRYRVLAGSYEPEMVDAVLAVYEGRTRQEEEEKRRNLQQLRNCIEKLPEQHRKILQSRYETNLPMTGVAEIHKKSVSAVETLLCRLRSILLECVKRQVRLSS